MNDRELDEALNQWQAPAPSTSLRARVIAGYPQRAPRNFGRLLRIGLAMAAVLCLLAVASAQMASGPGQGWDGTAASIAGGLNRMHMKAINRIHDLWAGHVADSFRNSNPKIFVDGDLRNDVELGGSGAGLWVRIPGEGKYLVALRKSAFEGSVPPRSGRFDGHVLQFQAGAQEVRIESHGVYGFHERYPVYVLGPVQR